MPRRVLLSVRLAAALCAIGCQPKLPSFDLPDAGGGSAGTGSTGCPPSYTRCDSLCCPAGLQCTNGACTYPYSTARLHVYLCPSFNMGCSANFFALNQTCSPIRSPQPGSCYDTGFDVAAKTSYALASCTACGSGCGSPASLRTPAGFLAPDYYSGSTWFCGTPCEAPANCGGHAPASVARCSTFDCWLAALSIRENAAELPLVLIKQPSAPSSTAASNPSHTPSITKINGTSASTTTTSITLTTLHGAGATTEFDYDFSDPTGCSPAICFSLPHCPSGVSCSAGTTTVCTRAKQDAALVGSVVRTLGFTAEPADAASTQLPLVFQPVSGPMDPATGTCSDPIDDSDPNAPQFAAGVLVGTPIEADVSVLSVSTAGTAGSGAGGHASAAGSGGSSQLDCSCTCQNGKVCTSHADCGIDENGIPNPCGCPIGPPCN
jgi:hypothetical protein